MLLLDAMSACQLSMLPRRCHHCYHFATMLLPRELQ